MNSIDVTSFSASFNWSIKDVTGGLIVPNFFFSKDFEDLFCFVLFYATQMLKVD